MTNVVPFTTRLEKQREEAKVFIRNTVNHSELDTPLGERMARLLEQMEKSDRERGR